MMLRMNLTKDESGRLEAPVFGVLVMVRTIRFIPS